MSSVDPVVPKHDADAPSRDTERSDRDETAPAPDPRQLELPWPQEMLDV